MREGSSQKRIHGATIIGTPFPASIFSENGHPRTKIGKLVGGSPHLNLAFGELKGGPEPLEKEIHEILGSKCED